LEVDEALDGKEAWQVTLDAPALYVTLRLDRPAQLRSLLEFFQRPKTARGPETLSLGRKSAGSSVVITRDGESARYFLTLPGAMHHTRITVTQAQADELAAALSDVLEQLRT
jgi:hypothetical protein